MLRCYYSCSFYLIEFFSVYPRFNIKLWIYSQFSYWKQRFQQFHLPEYSCNSDWDTIRTRKFIKMRQFLICIIWIHPIPCLSWIIVWSYSKFPPFIFIIGDLCTIFCCWRKYCNWRQSNVWYGVRKQLILHFIDNFQSETHSDQPLQFKTAPYRN